MTLPSFFADAECKGLETRWFFPWNPGPDMRPGPLAVQACSRCGVRAECLTFSLAPFQPGYWGGMTEEERLAERKRRHIQKQTDQRRAARKAAAQERQDEVAA